MTCPLGRVSINERLMELETKEIKPKRSRLTDLLVRYWLRKIAGELVRATKKSKKAAKELLYGVPGVFAVRLAMGRYSVRLIKEADEFRIMKKTEKCAYFLTIKFKDRAALGEVGMRRGPLQRAFSEERVLVLGATSDFAVVTRVSAERNHA